MAQEAGHVEETFPLPEINKAQDDVGVVPDGQPRPLQAALDHMF